MSDNGLDLARVVRTPITWGLGVVLVVAAILRLAGIDAGLPLVLNDDEVTVVTAALRLSWDDLNPHVFMYGSLPLYLLRLIFAVGEPVVQLVSGRAMALPEFYLASRVAFAFASILTVWMVFILGKTMWSVAAGLASALLLAISPLAVQLAHYATVDSLLGLFCTSSFVCLAAWGNGDKRMLVPAGVLAGLATATKINAAILFVPIVGLVVVREWHSATVPTGRARLWLLAGLGLIGGVIWLGAWLGRDWILAFVTTWTTRGQLQPVYVQIFDRLIWVGLGGLLVMLSVVVGMRLNWKWANLVGRVCTRPDLIRAFAGAAIAFLIVSPFVILDFPAFTRDIFFQMNKNISGGAVGYFPGSRSYLAVVSGTESDDLWQYLVALGNEWGWIVFAIVVIGFGILWFYRRSLFLSLGLSAMLMLGLAMTWRYLALRYLYPLWSIYVVAGGMGLVYLYERWQKVGLRLVGTRLAGAGMLTAILAFPTFGVVNRVHTEYLTVDTRNLALNWVLQKTPSGTFMVREWDTPAIESVHADVQVHFTGFIFEEATLRDWSARGVTMMLLSTRRREFYRAHAQDFSDVLAEYDRLESEWELVQSFAPGAGVKGPPVYIYVAPPK